MPVWLSDGKIVLQDGAVVLCDECPCDQTGCVRCPDGAIARFWRLVVADVTANPTAVSGTNASCLNANGTFILEMAGMTDASFECGGEAEFITMPILNACSGDTTGTWKLGWLLGDWYLSLDDNFGGAIVSYSLSDADFDCLGPNTFSLFSTVQPLVDCCVFPATLTIEPD